ncbi:MAG: endonuclease/exonuclease/phosphatase family protein, partial [Egibacteraceae bacterium]
MEHTRRPRYATATALRTALLAPLLTLALVGSLAGPASAGLLRGGAPAGALQASAASGPELGAQMARARRAKFQLATFNILGSNHTRNSRRYAGGTSRARTTSKIIKRRGTDVIGMQEVQDDQLRVLKRNLPGFNIWPRRKLGNNGVRLQIAWRTKRFAHVGQGHITTTFSHQQRPIPWVKLRDRRTGARFFVVSIHNSPGNQERARDKATRKEIRLVKRLRRRGKP